MRTKITIDDELLLDAQRIGGFKTRTAAVNRALMEFIQRRKQQEILTLFGKIDFHPKFDHKAGRER